MLTFASTSVGCSLIFVASLIDHSVDFVRATVKTNFAHTLRLLPCSSLQQLALLVVTLSPATDMAVILVSLLLFNLVELLHLLTFLLEHFIELTCARLSILLVLVDQ